MVKKKKVKPDISQLRCPLCDVAFFYYRVNTNDYRCRKCGTTFTWNEAKGKTIINRTKEKKA